jgi:hypothetical protein
MSEISLNGSCVGNALSELLMADDMRPGDEMSYQAAKQIYLFHPLGAKMAELPVSMAMSQRREITVPGSPEKMIIDAFWREWNDLQVDKHIGNIKVMSRIYGVASIIYGAVGVPTDKPIAPKDLADLKIYFNDLDPLNTAGSLVLNQDPNSPDFQKQESITVAGQQYHRTRSCTIMNENPIYIAYTNSAFGFVGRSVYQRALYPLKSFVQSMITDDLVTKKAGVLVAKMKQSGSVVDRTMQIFQGIKRNLLKEAKTTNVIGIGVDEDIETLNMQNTDTAMKVARKNILENIAAASKMPAKLLNSESFAEGFGEGTEDAKDIVRYINGIRIEMQPLYDFFDPIVMHRAWNQEFYKTVQNEFPAFKDIGYTQAFYDWKNAFKASWPNLIEEPESEKSRQDDVKLKAAIAIVEVLLPQLDPDNKINLYQWFESNISERESLFNHPLVLDFDSLRDYVPPEPMQEPAEPRPFADSVRATARRLR